MSEAEQDAEWKRVGELYDLLMDAYCDGYAQAVLDLEEHGQDRVSTQVDTGIGVHDSEVSEYVGECAYYHFDGRPVDLEFWIRDQFDDGDGDE